MQPSFTKPDTPTKVLTGLLFLKTLSRIADTILD
jgi:hypothetical protein